ncbi:MAG: STAS domain-containing protein [Flavobacteriales bacterium]|nr:STAS domain-containing protein [Flavobacteriales bacterium]
MVKKKEALIDVNPIHVVWEGILLLPVYGVIDSKRGQDIMESMLEKIVDTQSKVIILDILGVATVDSAVANHLIKITQATKLMGADCIISGISPAIAQTLVSLGISLGDVETQATLKDALENAFKMMDLKVIETNQAVVG